MKIKINDTYFIQCKDGINVDVCKDKHQRDKDDNEIIEVLGHYSTVVTACRELLEYELKETETRTVEGLINKIIKAKGEIIAAVKNAESLDIKKENIDLDFLG